MVAQCKSRGERGVVIAPKLGWRAQCDVGKNCDKHDKVRVAQCNVEGIIYQRWTTTRHEGEADNNTMGNFGSTRC